MSGAELLWLTATIVGAGACGWLTHTAVGDLRAAQDSGDELRVLLAWEEAVTEITTTVTLTLFVLVGVWAALTPPAPEHAGAPVGLRLAVSGAFVLAAALLSAAALFRRRARRAYIERWQARERARMNEERSGAHDELQR